jgi:uncharacterized protein (UPF0332 family)
VTPGQSELALDELRTADQSLRDTRLLLAAGALESATSRLYYSVFHAARAALVVRGLSSRTHSGLISIFNRTFGEASVLGKLFEKRGEADYSMEPFTWDAPAIEKAIPEAEAFVERCRGIVSSALDAGPDEPDPPPDL